MERKKRERARLAVTITEKTVGATVVARGLWIGEVDSVLIEQVYQDRPLTRPSYCLVSERRPTKCDSSLSLSPPLLDLHQS
ncbi:hypothetical protein V6N11_001299 [Hibiscus sabdariffa]|uniref:Uncharacterized protein n=1 Tax=Hibiscus sabdariffa TaxID=183260 RepID=A0ABR2RZU0_9ROSI